uniref:BTAD domain-containing putative transcriptional regulator n=1 Tax=Nonomuraea pusilla TaxID=46177 RepID=UPI0006E3CAF5|nr:BTAD domain-containing putative transcriptional regulator [Nonomuraea pusilla]
MTAEARAGPHGEDAWGRTAEALARFARVRRTLAEDLGVEPGRAAARPGQEAGRADVPATGVPG